MTEEEKMYDYNKIMLADSMTIEEAEIFIDEMYQDRYKIMEEKSENGVTIKLDKLNDIKFTNLEFASVRALREIQSLRRKIEKQQKEIEDKDKQIDKLSLIRQETKYGYENVYIMTEDRLVTIELNKFIVEIANGEFVDIRKLYDDYKDSVPKEAIREKMKELEEEKEQLRIEKNVTWDSGIYKLDLKINILKEILGE